MQNPSKPQMALAWIGERPLVEQAFGAMKAENFGAPQKIGRTPCLGVESELWNYLFFLCSGKGDALPAVRKNANSPIGVVWFVDLLYPQPSSQEEELLLYYAGQLKAPCLVFLVNTQKIQTPHEQEERALRERLLSYGFAADEAPFFYAIEDLSEPDWKKALPLLYTRLDESLPIPKEKKLYGRSVSASTARLALFSRLRPTLFEQGASLCLVFKRGYILAWLAETPKPSQLTYGWCLTATFTFLSKSELYLDELCYVITAEVARQLKGQSLNQIDIIDYKSAAGHTEVRGYVL